MEDGPPHTLDAEALAGLLGASADFSSSMCRWTSETWAEAPKREHSLQCIFSVSTCLPCRPRG